MKHSHASQFFQIVIGKSTCIFVSLDAASIKGLFLIIFLQFFPRKEACILFGDKTSLQGFKKMLKVKTCAHPTKSNLRQKAVSVKLTAFYYLELYSLSAPITPSARRFGI